MALATRLSLLGEAGGVEVSVLLVEKGTAYVLSIYALLWLLTVLLLASVHQHPGLQNVVAHPLQTRALHGSAFDWSYRTTDHESESSSKDGGQFTTKEFILNSGEFCRSLVHAACC